MSFSYFILSFSFVKCVSFLFLLPPLLYSFSFRFFLSSVAIPFSYVYISFYFSPVSSSSILSSFIPLPSIFHSPVLSYLFYSSIAHHTFFPSSLSIFFPYSSFLFFSSSSSTIRSQSYSFVFLLLSCFLYFSPFSLFNYLFLFLLSSFYFTFFFLSSSTFHSLIIFLSFLYLHFSYLLSFITFT